MRIDMDNHDMDITVEMKMTTRINIDIETGMELKIKS
jgi:hypothetical protein